MQVYVVLYARQADDKGVHLLVATKRVFGLFFEGKVAKKTKLNNAGLAVFPGGRAHDVNEKTRVQNGFREFEEETGIRIDPHHTERAEPWEVASRAAKQKRTFVFLENTLEELQHLQVAITERLATGRSVAERIEKEKIKLTTRVDDLATGCPTCNELDKVEVWDTSQEETRQRIVDWLKPEWKTDWFYLALRQQFGDQAAPDKG